MSKKAGIFKIRSQLLIIIIPIAIIPLIIIVSIVTNRIFAHLENQSRQYYSTLLVQVSNNLNFVYSQYARTLSNMMSIPEVIKGIDNPPYLSMEDERTASSSIVGDESTRGGLRNTVEERIEGAVFLYDLNCESLIDKTSYKVHYVSSSNIAPKMELFLNDPLFLKLRQNNKEKMVFGKFQNSVFGGSEDKPVIIFPYYKENSQKETFDEFILITLFTDFVPKFYEGIDSLRYGTLYILDQFDNVLSKNHPGNDDYYEYDPGKKQYVLNDDDPNDPYEKLTFKDYQNLNTDAGILNQKEVRDILNNLSYENITALEEAGTMEEVLNKKYYVTRNNVRYLTVIGYEKSSFCKFIYFHPVDQIVKPIYDIVSIIIIITFFIMIIVVIISMVFSSAITKPIMSLSDASLKIAKGNYDISIDVSTNNEMKTLSKAFNIMVKEVKNYTYNLEKMVEERTGELKDAHDKLQMAHSALWSEMELAKKIQLSLLPVKPFIPGYDISAKMIAADEVGGDFYDIFDYGKRSMIAIGDVSGHGVTPGLITMIAQTIIDSLVTKDNEIELRELYINLNALLIKSIKKLDVKMYITMSMLQEYGDGLFRGCGKHNDILVYRAETNTVEIIETNGIWLCIMENISEHVKEYKIKLNKGDIMLLYTDGLSEAANAEGKMFGDFMPDYLLKYSNLTSKDILNNILSDFQNFLNKTEDDVTLLVIKRE